MSKESIFYFNHIFISFHLCENFIIITITIVDPCEKITCGVINEHCFEGHCVCGNSSYSCLNNISAPTCDPEESLCKCGDKSQCNGENICVQDVETEEIKCGMYIS